MHRMSPAIFPLMESLCDDYGANVVLLRVSLKNDWALLLPIKKYLWDSLSNADPIFGALRHSWHHLSRSNTFASSPPPDPDGLTIHLHSITIKREPIREAWDLRLLARNCFCGQHNCCTKLCPVAAGSRLIATGSILRLNGLQTSPDNHIKELQVTKGKWKPQNKHNVLESIFPSPLLHQEVCHSSIWRRSHFHQRYSQFRHCIIKIIICFERLKGPFSCELLRTNGGTHHNQSIHTHTHTQERNDYCLEF